VSGDVFDELFDAAEHFHARFTPDQLTPAPTRNLAILACMDARLDLFRLLELEIGDAHLLRNAGGRATDDALRSLVVSANWLGTRRALVIHHTMCGLLGQTNESMREHVLEHTGHDPGDTEFHAISDLEESVREDVARIRACPFLPEGYEVRGAIYSVETGELKPVQHLPGAPDG
jgi:carbonic anhydrase